MGCDTQQTLKILDTVARECFLVTETREHKQGGVLRKGNNKDKGCGVGGSVPGVEGTKRRLRD